MRAPASIQRHGFTLIELLIVVAIIAILAAIAVPNFLEAQTRSKVSRTKADIRTQAVALEAYYVDHNQYTRDSDSSLDTQGGASIAYTLKANGATQLTTPVAYITSLLTDPFVVEVGVDGLGAQGYRIGSGTWSYANASDGGSDEQNASAIFAAAGKKPNFVIIGVGPDKNRCRIGYKAFPFQPQISGREGPAGATGTDIVRSGQPGCYTDYDPSNGTLSIGDIYQFGGTYTEGRFNRNGQAIGAGSQVTSVPGTW